MDEALFLNMLASSVVFRSDSATWVHPIWSTFDDGAGSFMVHGFNLFSEKYQHKQFTWGSRDISVHLFKCLH